MKACMLLAAALLAATPSLVPAEKVKSASFEKAGALVSSVAFVSSREAAAPPAAADDEEREACPPSPPLGLEEHGAPPCEETRAAIDREREALLDGELGVE